MMLFSKKKKILGTWRTFNTLYICSRTYLLTINTNYITDVGGMLMNLKKPLGLGPFDLSFLIYDYKIDVNFKGQSYDWS